MVKLVPVLNPPAPPPPNPEPPPPPITTYSTVNGDPVVLLNVPVLVKV
jgi:hypothetical protein